MFITWYYQWAAGNPTEAIKSLQAGYRYQPNNVDALSNLAVALSETGSPEYARAIKYLRKDLTKPLYEPGLIS